MMLARKIGQIEIVRVLEYAGPTHPPQGLFPELQKGTLQAHREMMAGSNWIELIDRLIVPIQLWIVKAGGNTILVDTGVGNRKDRPAIGRMHQLNTLVQEWMAAAGVSPEAVTHVVMTHLHADHVGWNTKLVNDRWEPTFPNARYYLPRVEFDFCASGRNRTEGVDVFGESFLDSVMPVVDAGLAEMIAPGAVIADCLRAEAAPGHSPGQLIYRFSDDNQEGVFCADIMHSPLQIVRPELNTGYCIWPDMARQTRRAFLEQAAIRGTLILPAHFGAPHVGYVRRQGEGFAFEASDW
jgi:glyoxylase-like metal-dependent hydrolase (beta-lactamase superfamily II)